MTQENKTRTKLRFFGIGKILPFMKTFKNLIILMAVLGLITSLIDGAITLFRGTR